MTDPEAEPKAAAAANDMAAFGPLLAWNRPELPVVFRALIGLNVAAFLGILALGGGLFEINSAVHLAWGANYGPAIAGQQYWRLLSSAFLHFGLLHLVFNMMALYSLGGLAERLYGRRAFLLLYLGAALIGSLASVLFSPDRTVSAGASGAIFGLGGALAAFWLRNGEHVPLSVLKGQWINLAVFIGFSVYMALTATGIDNAAHGGGFLAGAALGLMLGTPLDRPGTASWPRLGLGLAALLLTMALILPALPEPAYRYPAEQPVAEAIDAALHEDQRLDDLGRQMAAERTMPPADYLRRVETELLEPWREVLRGLDGLEARPESRLAERLQAMQHYAGLRVALYEAYLQALRGDAAKQREIEALVPQLKQATKALEHSFEKR